MAAEEQQACKDLCLEYEYYHSDEYITELRMLALVAAEEAAKARYRKLGWMMWLAGVVVMIGLAILSKL